MTRIMMILPIPLPDAALPAFAAQLPPGLVRPDIQVDFCGVRAGTTVLDSLGRRITSGDAPAGTPLTLESIGSEFGVSRTVAREVMRLLEGLGLVRSKRRVGLVVLGIEEWNVLDPRVIRWRLEGPGRDPQLHTHVLMANLVATTDGGWRAVWSRAFYRHARTASSLYRATLRDVLTQLAAPDGPPAVTGVRDALAVAGNLSGESETQIFLKTANDAPVSLNVVRRPNMDPEWGVSWSELVDQSAQPPQKDTLQWYRLACFLPRQLPPGAILSGSGSDKMLASTDYRYVLDQLGSCARTRGGPPKF